MKRLWLIPVFMALLLSVFSCRQADAKIIQEHVFLAAAGDTDKIILEKLKDAIPGALPVSASVRIEPRQEIPAAAFDPSRGQYDARAIIDAVSERTTLALSNERMLVVVDVDLYAEGHEYIFGLADPKTGICVVSTARLRNEFYSRKPDNRLLVERLLKESLYELALSWKRPVCENPKCVIFSSRTLADIDRQRASFCYKCRVGIETKDNGVTLLDAVKFKK